MMGSVWKVTMAMSANVKKDLRDWLVMNFATVSAAFINVFVLHSSYVEF